MIPSIFINQLQCKVKCNITMFSPWHPLALDRPLWVRKNLSYWEKKKTFNSGRWKKHQEEPQRRDPALRKDGRTCSRCRRSRAELNHSLHISLPSWAEAEMRATQSVSLGSCKTLCIHMCNFEYSQSRNTHTNTHTHIYINVINKRNHICHLLFFLSLNNNTGWDLILLPLTKYQRI